jgi:uncharacterized membrane protein YkvA (DUF1232 family)
VFDKLKAAGRVLKRELKVYQSLLKDPRTPKPAKFLLGFAVSYALLPFDIIPDFLPIIGHMDDLIIIPALVLAALKMTPQEVIEDCRARVMR